MNNPIEVEVSRDKTVAVVDIPLAATARTTSRSPPSTPCATSSLPQTVGQVDGVEYAVGGTTAADQDWSAGMKRPRRSCSASSCSSRSSCC